LLVARTQSTVPKRHGSANGGGDARACRAQTSVTGNSGEKKNASPGISPIRSRKTVFRSIKKCRGPLFFDYFRILHVSQVNLDRPQLARAACFSSSTLATLWSTMAGCLNVMALGRGAGERVATGMATRGRQCAFRAHQRRVLTQGPTPAPAPPPAQAKTWWNRAEWWGGAGAIAGWGMSGAAIYDASTKGAFADCER
jgi:hypothetical protein